MAWGSLVDPPVEDQLHLVGTAQVEVFPNDFLEENAGAQYFKQVPGVSQVGARTETTVNHPRDFYLGKRRSNLPALRQVGFQANRRLLEVERLSHDCAVGEETLHQLNRPLEVDGQCASALRTTDTSVCWLCGMSWSGFVFCLVVFPIETYASNLLCSPGKRPPRSPKAE